MRENLEKRERAEKKILDEKLLQQKRDNDISNLQDDMQYLTEIKWEMEAKTKSFKLYEEYLHNVIRSSQEFRTINCIMLRYDELIEAKGQVMSKEATMLQAIENARSNMVINT